MPAKLIDGKKIADALLERLKKEVEKMPSPPCLAIVLVGEDPASLVYTKKKHEACARVGMISRNIKLPESASDEKIIAAIQQLNNDTGVDGILVQLPLPKGIDENKVLEAVLPEKDVDGFHPENFGKMVLDIGKIIPCTPKGVIHLLKESGIALSGKHAVVMGRSRIVGKPLALLLLNENCTVTICHSKTKNIQEITRQADIVCVAVGKPNSLTADMVNEGAVVIDIGTNKVGGKLVGDADFDAVKEKASFITPVPGGVGPMTIAMLLENTLICCKERRK